MPGIHPPIIPYRDLTRAIKTLGRFVPPEGVTFALIVRPMDAGANIAVRLNTLGGGAVFEVNTLPTDRTLACLTDEAEKLLENEPPSTLFDFTGIGRDQ